MKTSKQAYAYTPGLKIKEVMTVIKERKLPIQGKVLVKEGEAVSYDTMVAETFVSGDPYIVQASVMLGILPEALKDCMTKNIGDPVEKDEILAIYSMIFGLFKRYIRSPVKGALETISDVTGQIIIRSSPIPVNVNAYITGKVVKVIPRVGAIIETRGAFIQGILGIGGEKHGKINVAVETPDEILTSDKISPTSKGHILVGGSLITLDAIRKAVEIGASGIVVGGIDSEDLEEFMGIDIGVAITGEEEVGITLIITEGLGKMTMSRRTFELLKEFEGHLACINGATQIRAGVLRPEIIIPHDKLEKGETEALSQGMIPGTPIRIIRQPYFGAIGKVHSLPVELQQLESESKVRVVNIELEDGKVVMVPRANVEIIEE